MDLFTFLGSQRLESLKRALGFSLNPKHLINKNESFLSFWMVLKALKELSPHMTPAVTYLDFFGLLKAIVAAETVVNNTTLKTSEHFKGDFS